MNVILQDLTAMIQNTSRYNSGQFDIVHVENIIQTDEPIPQDKYWYIPNGVTPNPVAEVVFKAKNMVMYPMSEEELLAGTSDIIEQAKSGSFDGVLEDTSKLMMLSLMKKQSLEPITGSSNLYRLSYDYKLFPVFDIPNTFDFKVQLPFSGLGVVTGGAVQMTVIMPLTSQPDPTVTEGIDINGQSIQELITPIQNVNRNIISFRYQNDPVFTIRYRY
jgi:hypothetical protein